MFQYMRTFTIDYGLSVSLQELCSSSHQKKKAPK